MARVIFLLKPTLIYYLCTTLALAHLSISHIPQNDTTTTWKNNNASLPNKYEFSDGSFIRIILMQSVDDLYGFSLCFHCKISKTHSCYLSIVFTFTVVGSVSVADVPPLTVWSANRDHPIGENSELLFLEGGGLVLKDPNGHIIWETSTTSNSPAIGMRMTSSGNLVLLNGSNGTVWQSFDHPTDRLLLGQRLRKGQKLTSSKSSVDMSSGLFYLSINSASLSAYVMDHNSSLYLRVFPYGKIFDGLDHIEFTKGSLHFFYNGDKPSIGTPYSRYLQIMRLDADGGLRIYCWEPGNGWLVIHYFSDVWEECQYPLKCGRYGLCQDGQCTCPVALDGARVFTPSDDHGCQQIDYSETKGANDVYELRNFGNLSYFNYYDPSGATPGLYDEESCKQACLRADTSCMAAFYLNNKGGSRGQCYMVSQVLSIIGTVLPIFTEHTSAYIKVKKISSFSRYDHSSSKSRMMLVGLAGFVSVLLCVFVGLLLRRKKVRRESLYLKKLSETLLRFSYSDLSTVTHNFSERVGRGGFGLVYKGTLLDGREVAVKRLRDDGQGKKEFLAEVETVGKIHHFNLVNLIGFCFEKKHLILVYEYLTNGSLEKWIFSENQNTGLDWKLRKKIVMDIAKGLAYIHEECVQRIAHLDIKPHNILLDDNFNAKVSDFGMSKLIKREESQVMTGMRGTLGYLAPEWRESRITVKADVYSFGILVLEVVSGRKVLDFSQPEYGVHLLKLLKNKCIENRLRDIVDSRNKDMVSNYEDVVDMIRLAMWCLHSDYKRRPTMSSVVKVLEGNLVIEPNVTYNFSSIFSPVCSVSNTTVVSIASYAMPL